MFPGPRAPDGHRPQSTLGRPGAMEVAAVEVGTLPRTARIRIRRVQMVPQGAPMSGSRLVKIHVAMVNN